ncbi:MAG: 50S ribosomal protein L11 methyltransferase [Thermodesulfobacteriota bacterium]
MKWCAARVEIDSGNPHADMDTVSDVFLELGLSGVVLEDPGLEPPEEWGEDAVQRPDRYAVIGYFPMTDTLSRQQQRLEDLVAGCMPKGAGRSYRITYSSIEEEDWAEAWKSYFHPIRVSDRFVVKPTWRDYASEAGEIVLEIDPGMAFGTGMHPTTVLCIRALETVVQPGMRVLDVGTGSGILALAAAKLGAAQVIGVDMDPVASAIAARNLRLNGIQNNFLMFTGRLIESVRMKADIVVSNILTDVVLALSETVRDVMTEGGIWIASGIVESKAQVVSEALKNTGFQDIDQEMLEGWVCIRGRA